MQSCQTNLSNRGCVLIYSSSGCFVLTRPLRVLAWIKFSFIKNFQPGWVETYSFRKTKCLFLFGIIFVLFVALFAIKNEITSLESNFDIKYVGGFYFMQLCFQK